MLGRIVASLSLAFLLAASLGAEAQAQCRPGFVWREAFRGDFVCVTPQTREETRDENMMARSGWVPGGGAYGQYTCVSGLVWRNAGPNDVVCVTPRSRDRAAGVPMQRQVPEAAHYRVGDWSRWARSDGVEYRYRWGWNPRDQAYARNIDAIFEVRNPRGEAWRGTARSTACEQETLSRMQDVALAPGETREVRFRTPNCGTLEQPFFRGGVARTHRID
jgi:hypothetical protein